MTVQEIQRVKDAIDSCNLKYSVRANRWIIIKIPFCKFNCVHLLIPIDIQGYRLQLLFENGCINDIDISDTGFEVRVANTYKIVVLKKSNIVPDSAQIAQDLKDAYQSCKNMGLV